jgi:hypothetical protein
MGLYDTTQARVGLNTQADGTPMPLRATRMGGLANADSQGRYYEQVSRGNVFSLILAATTTNISAGNIDAATAAASTQFALWNPAGSGKNLSLLKFAVNVISGTLPAGGLHHSWGTAPSIATTVVSPISNNLLGAPPNCVARAATHATGTALTGGGALNLLRDADLQFTAGAAAILMTAKAVEYIDGDIVIQPGYLWVPTWTAVGTTVLNGYSITWEEIPV